MTRQAKLLVELRYKSAFDDDITKKLKAAIGQFVRNGRLAKKEKPYTVKGSKYQTLTDPDFSF